MLSIGPGLQAFLEVKAEVSTLTRYMCISTYREQVGLASMHLIKVKSQAVVKKSNQSYRIDLI